MDIVLRRVPHSREVTFVGFEQSGFTVPAGTEIERWDGTVAVRLGIRSVVGAWFRGRTARRAKLREHREMGYS